MEELIKKYKEIEKERKKAKMVKTKKKRGELEDRTPNKRIRIEDPEETMEDTEIYIGIEELITTEDTHIFKTPATALVGVEKEKEKKEDDAKVESIQPTGRGSQVCAVKPDIPTLRNNDTNKKAKALVGTEGEVGKKEDKNKDDTEVLSIRPTGTQVYVKADIPTLRNKDANKKVDISAEKRKVE